MTMLVIAPSIQTHHWSLYLNAPSYTSTLRVDAFAVKVKEDEKVEQTIEKICPQFPGDFMKRRTEGFAEKWQQILCMGNELDTALRWTDFGINFDCSAVSVVLRNIAAEGLSNFIPTITTDLLEKSILLWNHELISRNTNQRRLHRWSFDRRWSLCVVWKETVIFIIKFLYRESSLGLRKHASFIYTYILCNISGHCPTLSSFENIQGWLAARKKFARFIMFPKLYGELRCVLAFPLTHGCIQICLLGTCNVSPWFLQQPAALLVQRRPALRPCNVNKKFCINHLIVTLKLTDKE